MSTHPNAMLLCILTPDGLTRKTLRAILADYPDEFSDDDIKINGRRYHTTVMESGYDDIYQISAPEGTIVVFNFLTYGYGEAKPWSEVVAQYDELQAWANRVCEQHHCTAEISIGANYW